MTKSIVESKSKAYKVSKLKVHDARQARSLPKYLSCFSDPTGTYDLPMTMAAHI